MRYFLGLVCVLALGVIGCGGSQDECTNLGIYECLDDQSCTLTYGSDDRDCSAMTQAACATNLEPPVAHDGENFCTLWIRSDGTTSFNWIAATFCEQDADCGEGGECFQFVEWGMLRGECGIACVEDCQSDADCPEGHACWQDIGCGVSSQVVGVNFDGSVAYCVPE